MPKADITFGWICYISAWGYTKMINGSNHGKPFETESPEDLMTAPLNILTKSECFQELLKQNDTLTYDMFESIYDELFPEGICASNQRKSGCKGDSGGPFVCEEYGKAVVHGIASGVFDINFGMYLNFLS